MIILILSSSWHLRIPSEFVILGAKYCNVFTSWRLIHVLQLLGLNTILYLTCIIQYLSKKLIEISILFAASSEDNIIFLLDINNGGAIHRMNLHTLSYVQIPINRLYTPTAFDYDANEGRIYFVDPRLQQIVSVHFSGTDIRELQQLNAG